MLCFSKVTLYSNINTDINKEETWFYTASPQDVENHV